MSLENSLTFDGMVVLDDARITDRKTISVPQGVMRHLRVGPRDYLRFLITEHGELAVRGMTLTPIQGSQLEQVAEDRTAAIQNGTYLTLDEIQREVG